MKLKLDDEAEPKTEISNRLVAGMKFIYNKIKMGLQQIEIEFCGV